MRILHAIAGYGAEHIGGEIHGELAREIIERGHEYEILATSHARAMVGRRRDEIEEGIKVHRVTVAGRPLLEATNALLRLLLRFPAFLPSLIGFVRFLSSRPRYDVIVAESAFPIGAIIDLATRLVPQPLIVAVSGGDFIANDGANYGYARYRLPRRLMAATFRRAALVRAVSPYAASNARRLGCPEEKLAILQRNIGRSTFLPADAEPRVYRREASRRVREQNGLLGSGPLIVTVGRLLPIKGFDHLVEALPLMSSSARAACLLHVGPNRFDERLGDYRLHLEALADRRGLRERVRFAGPLPHAAVRDCLAGADVVVVPSLEEGGNKIVMEAAAAGTPSVMTNTTGTSDWARDAGCGLVVDPGSPAELARGIETVLADRTEAEAMGRRGLAFAEAFRPEVVADGLLALCRAAGRGGPPPPELTRGRLLRRGELVASPR